MLNSGLLQIIRVKQLRINTAQCLQVYHKALFKSVASLSIVYMSSAVIVLLVATKLCPSKGHDNVKKTGAVLAPHFFVALR